MTASRSPRSPRPNAGPWAHTYRDGVEISWPQPVPLGRRQVTPVRSHHEFAPNIQKQTSYTVRAHALCPQAHVQKHCFLLTSGTRIAPSAPTPGPPARHPAAPLPSSHPRRRLLLVCTAPPLLGRQAMIAPCALEIEQQTRPSTPSHTRLPSITLLRITPPRVSPLSLFVTSLIAPNTRATSAPKHARVFKPTHHARARRRHLARRHNPSVVTKPHVHLWRVSLAGRSPVALRACSSHCHPCLATLITAPRSSPAVVSSLPHTTATAISRVHRQRELRR